MATAIEIATKYTYMIESVNLINECIAAGDKDNETIECIRRNVIHLENQLTMEDIWTTEDMSDVNAAVTAGNAYIA